MDFLTQRLLPTSFKPTHSPAGWPRFETASPTCLRWDQPAFHNPAAPYSPSSAHPLSPIHSFTDSLSSLSSPQSQPLRLTPSGCVTLNEWPASQSSLPDSQRFSENSHISFNPSPLLLPDDSNSDPANHGQRTPSPPPAPSYTQYTSGEPASDTDMRACGLSRPTRVQPSRAQQTPTRVEPTFAESVEPASVDSEPAAPRAPEVYGVPRRHWPPANTVAAWHGDAVATIGECIDHIRTCITHRATSSNLGGTDPFDPHRADIVPISTPPTTALATAIRQSWRDIHNTVVCQVSDLGCPKPNWLTGRPRPEDTAEAYNVPETFVSPAVCAAVFGLLGAPTTRTAAPTLETLAQRNTGDAEFRSSAHRMYLSCVRHRKGTLLFVETYYHMYALTDSNNRNRLKFSTLLQSDLGTSRARNEAVQRVLLMCCCLRSAPDCMTAFMDVSPIAWPWHDLLRSSARGDEQRESDSHLGWLLADPPPAADEARSSVDGSRRYPQRNLATVIATFNHEAARRAKLNPPPSRQLSATKCTLAMTNLRGLSAQRQRVANRILVELAPVGPGLRYLPTELVQALVSLLFGTLTPNDYFTQFYGARQSRAAQPSQPAPLTPLLTMSQSSTQPLTATQLSRATTDRRRRTAAAGSNGHAAAAASSSKGRAMRRRTASQAETRERSRAALADVNNARDDHALGEHEERMRKRNQRGSSDTSSSSDGDGDEDSQHEVGDKENLNPEWEEECQYWKDVADMRGAIIDRMNSKMDSKRALTPTEEGMHRKLKRLMTRRERTLAGPDHRINGTLPLTDSQCSPSQ